MVIINDPSKGFCDDNFIAKEGDGTPCKHLEGDKPGEYKCAVHNMEWYKRTPCYEFGQIESSSDNICRMGEFILRNFREEDV